MRATSIADAPAAWSLWVNIPRTEEVFELQVLGKVGARTEMPGCSLCMGKQARVADKATVVSTSTRNFPNRLGQGANVYLASAELAAIASILGKLSTKAEYMERYSSPASKKDQTYSYLNFDQYEAAGWLAPDCGLLRPHRVGGLAHSARACSKVPMTGLAPR